MDAGWDAGSLLEDAARLARSLKRKLDLSFSRLSSSDELNTGSDFGGTETA
jgi:hypothetical protein